MAVPGSTRAFARGLERLTAAPSSVTVPGTPLRFPGEHDALRFVAALGDPLAPRALLGLLPNQGVVPPDEDQLRAALTQALVTGALKIYRAPLDGLEGPGSGGGGKGEGPEPPVPPTENDDAKVSATAAPGPLWILRSRIADADAQGNAFEGATLTITAELVEGSETVTGGALGVVRHDGSSVATHAFDASAGTHAWDHVTDTLPEAETSRRVRATMTVGAEAQQGHEDFTLWPRTVTLTVKHRDTGRALEGFVFKVLQSGAEAKGTTDAAGAVTVNLPKPAAFQVFAEPPSEITSWVDAKGRVREARGVTAFKAAIEKPAKPGAGDSIRQYVNLVSSDHGHDAKGHALRVVVKGEAPARQGDPVFVRVRFGRQSRRSSPLPAVTGLTDAVVEADSFLVTGHVKLGADLRAHFDIELGVAGGDTCDIAVGGTRAARDDGRRVENWRKIFYQVTRPSTMATPSLALMTAGLAKVFIEYEKYKEITFDEADAGTPAGSWFDGAHFGLSGRCVNIGDHNKAFFHAKFDDAKNPVGVHVLFCHAQFDGGSPAHKTTWTTTIGPTTAQVAFPGGGNVAGLRKKIGGHVFPKAFQDGNDSVRDVTWQSLAPSGPAAGLSGAIGSSDIHVNWMTDRNFVTIRLPAAALAVIAAGHSVQVTATALWSNGVYLGEADGTHGNWQLIRNNANDAATQTNAVMTHELGHTLFMVLKTTPPGTDAGAHGYKYTARGHQGPHCAFGVSDTLYASGGKLNGGGGTCVMFGEAGASSPSSFCPRCAPFVNAYDLATIV